MVTFASLKTCLFSTFCCCCPQNPSEDERLERKNSRDEAGTSSKTLREFPSKTLPIPDNPSPGPSQEKTEPPVPLIPHNQHEPSYTESPSRSSQELPPKTSPIPDNPSPGPSQEKNEPPVPPVPDDQSEPSYLDPPSLPNRWKLDTKFLQQIRDWNLTHPEKKLTHILKDICDGVNANSVLLELIPDNTAIPIRGLVKCLLHLFKLGVTVASAKDDTVAFIREVVTWLDALAYTFDSGGSGKLESDAWSSLDEMGQLINDACCWASKLLSPGIAINLRFSAESQIQEYRREFTRISERFSILSGIRLAQGLDNVEHVLDNVGNGLNNVKHGLDNVEHGLDNVEHGLNNVDHCLDNVEKSLDNVEKGLDNVEHGLDNVGKGLDNVAQDTHMILQMAENEHAATRRAEFLKGKLLRVIEHSSYNHQEKRPCEPGTRTEILNEIRTWFQDVSEESQCFYWLSGQPGVGKSAITASVVKDCIDRNVLGAQFFINRNDATTTDPRALFPTICWQLCQRFPQVAIVMEKALRAQPTVVDDISDDQATKLFVNAIVTATVSDPLRAVVVVIDALDETDTKRLGYLAQIFAKVVADLPQNAKVFISSRVEDVIRNPFDPLRSRTRVKSRYLAAKQSIEEVSEFMEKKVKEILREYNVDWARWGDERMRKLSSQASGLYIWAETALKFLLAEIQNSGIACIEGLLDMFAIEGMDDINELYLRILRRICKPGDWEYQRFRRIVGAILVRQAPLSIADIEQLLNLQERHYPKPVDLVHFVRQYRTVLVSDTEAIDGSVVPRVHKSFADFITSEWAQEFCVDVSATHGELALQCITQLHNMYAYLKGSGRPTLFPSQLVYASQHWHSHLTRMIDPDVDDDTGEKKEYDTPVKSYTQGFPAKPVGVKDLKLDAESMEGKGQLKLSLAFSPSGTQLALVQGHAIQIQDAITGSVTISLVGHKDNVHSIRFSPDGTQLVSASDDKTARIWDARTGKQLHVLRGHTWVLYAAFSHDGRKVITSSGDKTLRTWETNTGQQINVFKGHENAVSCCTFSQNDQRIASHSFSNILVWDVNSSKLISKFYHNHCHTILFCPCGDHLISRDDNGEIQLWDAESGKQLDHANPIDARLAFVDDSEQESTSNYIHVPPALNRSSSRIPHLYSLETKCRDSICGIVGHDQHEGVWEVFLMSREQEKRQIRLRLSFAAGATVMRSW